MPSLIGVETPYFSSGAFACRRDAIPFEKWIEAESWGKETPGLFGDFYEQPHAELFCSLDDATRRTQDCRCPICNIFWGHHGKEELMEDSVGIDWHFPKEIRRPRVAHFCGRKPFLFDRQSYSRPFTIARLEHHRRHHGDLGAWLAVLNEDCRVLASKVKGRIWRFVQAPRR